MDGQDPPQGSPNPGLQPTHMQDQWATLYLAGDSLNQECGQVNQVTTQDPGDHCNNLYDFKMFII